MALIRFLSLQEIQVQTLTGVENEIDAAMAMEETMQWIDRHNFDGAEQQEPSLMETEAEITPTAVSYLTPYCYNVMKTWLAKCVFGDGVNPAPDALTISPECTLIYNTNARECMHGGIMTSDQAVILGELGGTSEAPSFVETEMEVDADQEATGTNMMELHSNLELLDALQDAGVDMFENSEFEENPSMLETEAEAETDADASVDASEQLEAVATALVDAGYDIKLEADQEESD
jgi:hypothetical protein